MNSTEEIPRTNKILIVDDTDSNRTLLEAILHNAGYETDSVTNGVECLEYCMAQIPRLILLDIMMPEMDGFSVCKSLREVFAKHELPIVLVTTKSEGADLKQGFAVGANDYVVKPVDKLILLARMDGCLQLTDTHQSLLVATEYMEQALSVQKLIGDALPEVIVVHDEAGKIVYANNSLYEAIPDISFEQVAISVNFIFERIYEGLFHKSFQEHFLENLYDHEWSFNREMQVDDQVYQVFSEPIQFRDHFLRIWVWRDITSVRELERKINQQIRLDTVSLFASGVAHNFNNIMGGVLGASELLKRSEEERALKCQSIIQRAVESGMRLTEKMGALSRKGGTEKVSERPALAQTVEKILQRFQDEYNDRISFHSEIPRDLYLDITSKAATVLLENVISNSIDAIDKSGNVKVRFENPEDEEDKGSGRDTQKRKFGVLVVEDDGRGMVEEELERLFEPFYSTKNLDHANKVSVEGNGLGLWNVYNIVKMYEGDVEVESSKGKGTIVRLTLPLLSRESE